LPAVTHAKDIHQTSPQINPNKPSRRIHIWH